MTTTSSVDAVLEIAAPSITVDSYASAALTATAAYYSENDDENRSTILSSWMAPVETVTENLNSTSLDETVQLLLSNSTIYAAMVKEAVDEGASDETGIYNAVLRHVGNTAKTYFQVKILTDVLNDKHITVEESEVKWQILPDLVEESSISLASGKVEPAVMELLDTVYERGELYYYLNSYIARSEIDESQFTDAIKEKMLDRLVKLNLHIDAETVDEGTFDEYFALAYNEAVGGGLSTDDPIDQVYTTDFENRWDFTVDDLTAYDEQNVDENNILAAGALDYLYCIGEMMRVFDAADALVVRWGSALLDIPDGSTASALYRFHKRRSDRSSPEERSMLYKRVLNKGNGQVLSRMVINTDFTSLWGELMRAATEYIHKSERKVYWTSWQDNGVSLTHIYRVTEDLQYNLTTYMTGMAHLQVTEDYYHLKEALDIISSDDIRNYYGGSGRQSVWNTIERIVQEEFQVSLNTEAIKTLAIEGNKVFQWIANFNESTVTSNQFEIFIKAAEAWIVAQATLEGGGRHRQRPPLLPARQPMVAAGNRRSGNNGFVEAEFNEFDEFDAGSGNGLDSNSSEEFDRW